MENRKLYLYVKESPLGLKYLGITSRKDPYKYMGSGIYWKSHIKYHNCTYKDIKTEIIFFSFNHEEIIEKGLYYSNLWNVVESNDWANLIPEAGFTKLGSKQSKETVEKRVSKLRGIPRSEETIEKVRVANTGKKRSLESRMKQSLYLKGKKQTPEQIQKRVKSREGYRHSEETRTKLEMSNGNKLRNKVTGEIYPSIKVVAELLNINSRTLRWRIAHTPNKCDIEYISKELKENGQESKIFLEIDQFDLKDNFIKHFLSINDIISTCGIKGYNIQACCRGKRESAYGYKWKYKNNNN